MFSPTSDAQLQRVFPGDSETAHCLRQVDWSTNDLGHPDAWPEALRAAVAICITSPFPMQVWWGPDRTQFYNDACMRLLGLKRHPSVLAQSGRAAPDVWDQVGPTIDRVFSRGEASGSENAPMWFARELPKEEVFVTSSFSPIHGASGRVEGVFCAFTETTENVIGARRLETLRELATSRAGRTIQETSHTIASVLAENPEDVPCAALYLFDGTAHHLGARVRLEQGEAGLGVTLPDAFTGLSELTVLPVELGPRHWPEPITQVVAVPVRGNTDGPIGMLICGVSPRRPLDASYRTFFELAASHVGAVLTQARAKEHERRRLEATRAKDDFLALFGHELRNPLSAVFTSLQVLQRRAPSREVELMDRSIRHLARLVDDLLDLSRLHRGRIPLHRRPIELAQIVDTALERTAPQLIERQTQVFVKVARSGLLLDCDPERIAQVIANVLSNASKFSEPGSKVTIAAERSGDRIRILVSDQGAGIEPSRLSSVFDAFQDRRNGAGLGLGLAIARSLVELHAGKIELHSSGVGTGTECVIELSADAVEAAAPVQAAEKRERKRVLLVEDNHDTAVALQRALESLGYKVALAHNGPVALTVARSFLPDVALVDIGLPVMDGWELANRLRELHVPSRKLHFIAVTARDQDADKRRSSDAGFADHLVKPIDLDRLERVVESLPDPT
ncbi:MAG TPA: ATP-binding protein [Kofleriaceae bacterium]|nr:ATP-binding protein [Kofleriaceae bacterium]